MSQPSEQQEKADEKHSSKPDNSITNTEENSELCMQEIVSPFRNLNLSRFQLETSPEPSPSKKNAEWSINPVKVPRHNFRDSVQPVMVLHESDGEHYSSYQSTFYEETEGTASICESPVKNEKYFAPSMQVISPGKLKQLV